MKDIDKDSVSAAFQAALDDPSVGTIQKEFIENRPISREAIEKWEVGYCPPDVFYFPFPLLRGRITLPLRDIYGNVQAFFGRRLEGNLDEISAQFDEDYDKDALGMFYKWHDSKWINEPYDKRKHLFGLWNNFSVIRNMGSVVLVEGCYDAVVLWDYGIRNVVAVCGTAFTFDQLAIILRTGSKRVFVLMDGDAAGETASMRIKKMLKEYIKSTILHLPGGRDPEDALRTPLSIPLKKQIEAAMQNPEDEIIIKE